MATKAQQFKAVEERSKPKTAKKPGHRPRPKAPGSDLPGAKTHTSEHNKSPRAAKNAVVALEDSESGKPSRKSSRGSAHHARATNTLELRQQARVRAPEARAARATAKKGRAK